MFTYDRVPRSIIRDGYIPPSIKNTFVVLRSYCNIHTRQGEVYIRELAADTQRTNRTICEHLSWLIKNEFIHRQLRKKKGNPKENDKSLFTILRWDLPEDGKNSVPTEKKLRDKDLEKEYKDIDTKEPKETNIREAETSSVSLLIVGQPTEQYVNPEALQVSETTSEIDCEAQEEAVIKESISAETVGNAPAPKNAPKELDFSNVPDKLRTTARTILSLSGRTKLAEDEVRLLVDLLEKHFPSRINTEIEDRAKEFKKMGRNMKSLTVYYIHSILKGQRTRPEPKAETSAAETPAEAITDPRTEALVEAIVSPRRKSNKKATKRTPKTECKEQSVPEVVYEPAELVMPVVEAEKVIADYDAEHAKPVEATPAIPAALEELFDKIQARESERIDEYFAALPKDEYGDPILPEEGEMDDMPIEDYLRLKYPKAEDEELCRDYSGHVYGSVSEHPEIGRIKAAFEIDYACAMCMTPENCQLPEGCRKGQDKLVTKMFTCEDGKKCLGAGFEGCIKCKHNRPKPAEKTPEEKLREAEFERMTARSGIVCKDKTFEAYNPETPEVIVAKAKAILAAKTGRNLVLAGKTGTGKTHLATAIALEAMKAGKQAIVITASEMLDKITQAYRDNTAPLETLMKYKNAPVLVIDDWDKSKATDARFDYLHQIVDWRYTHGLQTIVTTNAYDIAGLEHRLYAGRIEPMMSRLLENGDWVTIREAENYRLKKPEVAAEQKSPIVPPDRETLAECEPELKAESEVPEYTEAEVLAECEQIKAELASSEYKMLEETRAELDAELNARYCTRQQSEPEAPEPEEVVIPETDRSGKISLTEQPEALGAEAEQEPDFVPDLDAIPMMVSQFDVDDKDTEPDEDSELIAMSSEEWEEFCAKQKQKRECEERLRAMPKPPVKSWQEIAQSPEYQALSESNKLKRQWEYFRETPEYKNMLQSDKIAVQLDFGRRIREAEQAEEPAVEQGSQQLEPPEEEHMSDEEWEAFTEEWRMLKEEYANFDDGLGL